MNASERLSFVQINTNRSGTSMDLALATAEKTNSQFVLCSEPNLRVIKGSRWYVDKNGDAAITRVGSRPSINGTGRGKGFVWILTMGLYVYSCYASPNAALTNYEMFLHELFEDIMSKPQGHIIVTGDFNSKSPAWGADHEDRRGAALGEMAASLGLVFMNREGVPTFVRGNSASTIDLTMVSEHLSVRVANWNVLEEESMSPHALIAFKVSGKNIPAKEQWRRGPINKEKLRDTLAQMQMPTETSPAEMVAMLKKAYEKSTPKVRTKNGKVPYWWSDEIRVLREGAIRCRRKLTRARRMQNAEEIANIGQTYKDRKKQLIKEIKAAKKSCWRKLLEDLDEDVYGDGYKIVKKSLNAEGPAIELTKAAESALMDRLFPAAQVTSWTKARAPETPLFNLGEVRDAAHRLKNGKAPGPDGVPAEVVKVATEVIGEYMTAVYNALLTEGVFPEIWKTARVVFIEKPKKTQDAEKTYRPLCLIDAAGKVYESLVNRRIVEELDRTDGLSPQQHGFRAGHSTIDAIKCVMETAKTAHRTLGSWCLLGLVDVRNAFNTASWPKIIQAMENREIPPYILNVVKDYLSKRAIRSKLGNHRSCRVGVPQGSVIGPTLWNIMYDGILRMDTAEGVTLVGYADDVAVVSTHKNWDMAKAKMSTTMDDILTWLGENNLEMAPEKTELVALKYGRPKREGTIEVARHDVEISQSAKYLGIWLDTAVSFGPHIRATAAKASKTVTRLSKLMPNIGGPGELKRRTLGAVANSIILYGAPIWAGALNVATYRAILQSVQRKMALRICRGYRTVSYVAAAVVASMIPIHLLAQERKSIWEMGARTSQQRREERINTMRAWQVEWDASNKGRWTRRLIQDVSAWTARKHGVVDYYITQWLTGHGSFKSYVHRIGKSEDDRCEHCGASDTAEHAIFRCQRWELERATLNADLETTIDVENVINEMLRSSRGWTLVANLVKKIVSTKESEGRRR